MLVSDYRTLLADAIDAADRAGELDALHDVCVTALAARIPWLCPDCKGASDGMVEHRFPDGTWELVPCTHPNAPTIADLLRWGENVAKATVVRSNWGQEVRFGRIDYPTAAPLLAALRGEGQ